MLSDVAVSVNDIIWKALFLTLKLTAYSSSVCPKLANGCVMLFRKSYHWKYSTSGKESYLYFIHFILKPAKKTDDAFRVRENCDHAPDGSNFGKW